MPRLQRKAAVDVRLCHACHVKRRWMSPSVTSAMQNDRGCEIVPRLPRETKANVTKRNACHRKVPQPHVRLRATKPGRRAPPSATSAAPAMQNDCGCEIAPRLPREIKVDVTKCHACHAKSRGVMDVRLCHNCQVKSRWMSPSATPATQKWRGVTGVTRD